MTYLDLAPLSQAEAERLTEGIRVALDRTARGMADLAARVSEAYQRRADLALGYSSWAEYSEAEFGEATASLAAPIRRELVGYLSAEGMSTRAIAPAVGVSNKTVSLDRREVLPQVTPTPVAEAPSLTGATLATPAGVIIAEQHHVDIETGEIIDPQPEPEPRKVTGLDGKTYQRPAQQELKPRRTPIADTFFRTRFDLSRKADSLLKLIDDDRLAQNKAKVAQENLHDLNLAIEALQRVVATLQN